jgi:hypothetical protein
MDGGWKQVWAEMTDVELEDRLKTDSELEDHLFAYLWLSLPTPNAHAGRVAQLIKKAERRGKPEIVERACMRARRRQSRKPRSASATGAVAVNHHCFRLEGGPR